MKIIQVNLQRTRAGFDLILKAAEEHGACVILSSEPNITKARKAKWISNPRCNCAITVMRVHPFKVLKESFGDCFVRLDADDVTFYSVYLSFNDSRETFQRELLQLQNDVEILTSSSPNRKIIIGGDFNSKSALWNSPFEDPRGRILSEWFSTLELTILNRGNTPTYINGSSTSFIDITVCSEALNTHVIHWEVLLEENLSDHNSIIFEIQNNATTTANSQRNPKPTTTWRLKEDKIETFQRKILEKINAAKTPTDAVKLVQSVCDEVLPKKGITSKRKPVYWWNENIEDLRKECFAARRRLVRGNARRNRSPIEIENRKKDYFSKKKNLRKAIIQSQSSHWKKLCDDLNENVWGTGYKIVCKKFKALTTTNLSTQDKLAAVDKLFPQHQITEWQIAPIQPSDIPLFTMDELLEVFLKIPSGKAPGPDEISPEITKLLIKTAPDFFLNLFNDQLKKGTFPNIWKNARLVLIEKEMKPGDTEKSYRPICLLDILGKTYEKLIKLRLENEVRKTGGLSPTQYGFTPGKSTVDAMMEVKKMAEDAKKRKKLCILTMVDVKNAFNSTPWKGILEELKRRKIPPYLTNVLSSYFQHRNIIVDNAKKETSCGVPQGSVLGPVLWNIYYDPVLRIALPPNTLSLAYADDLVLITTGTVKSTIEMEVNLALSKVNNWMLSMQLELAPQKTEVVMLISSRAVPEITVEVAGIRTKSTESAKYLGVLFERNMRMTKHLRSVAEKAERIATNLGRLMPNISGPKNCKRKLLGAVVYSTLFYGIPAWADVLKYKVYRLRLEKVQRKIMLRLCRSYRTTSTVALQVLSGTLPIELMAEERTKIYSGRKANMDITELKDALNEALLTKWQTAWDQETQKGQWTKELIRNIKPWITRSYGCLNYELSQFLTGHGNFQSYLNKMGITQNNQCRYCNEVDDSRHMAFHCPRWSLERQTCWTKLGATQTPTSIIDRMMSSRSRWDAVSGFITTIVRTKNADSQRTANQPDNSVRL